jgi:prevent-host-death family protein
MQEVTALEAKTRIGQLIDAAQRRPVTFTKNGRAAVVVMSVEDYGRKRQSAAQRLGQIMDQAAKEAAHKDLTEAKLDELLADES